MAEILEQTTDLDTDASLAAAEASTESSADKAGATAKDPQENTNQAAEAPAADDELGILIQKVKTTIATSLDDQVFDKELRKHIKKIKGWKDWSEHAKSAFAHMWAAQLLHNKAVDIKKDNKMDFTPVTGDSYKKLVRSLTHRVRF